MKPLKPWWRPTLTGQEYARIKSVLDRNYLNDGDVTRAFEDKIKNVVGAKYAVGVTSGTAALFMSLAALDIGPGDEVLVPDLTFIATANAVRLSGARVVLVDVDEKTLTLKPEAMERAITPRTRAVIPVHVSGRGGTLDEVRRIARKRGLYVVEDAAEALLSKYRGRYLGTWGETGCLSFSPNKTLTTGQGGMVLTSSPKLYQRLIELKDQGRPVRGTGGDDPHPRLGYNFKLTNLQAAVGLAQFEALKSRIKKSQQIYKWYFEELAGVQGIELYRFDVQHGESPQWTDARAKNRDRLDQALRHAGYECRRFWRPLHHQPPYRLSNAKFPVSSRISYESLWLPSGLKLTRDDINRVSRTIRQFYKSR